MGIEVRLVTLYWEAFMIQQTHKVVQRLLEEVIRYLVTLKNIEERDERKDQMRMMKLQAVMTILVRIILGFNFFSTMLLWSSLDYRVVELPVYTLDTFDYGRNYLIRYSRFFNLIIERQFVLLGIFA